MNVPAKFLFIKKIIFARCRQRVIYWAGFAIDARGLNKVKGLKNSSNYTIENGKVYIKATRNIAVGAEIFVGHGKMYWDVIKKL